MEKIPSSTRTLQDRSIAGMCIIVGFILVSQFIIHTLIVGQTASSRVVNIAGRQRMLSQRLVKDVLILQAATSQTMRSTHLGELTETLQLWEKSHNGLQHGDNASGLPGSNSGVIVNLFADIEQDYRQMVIAAHCILSLETDSNLSGCETDVDSHVQAILLHEKAFLAGMDKIVFRYDEEAQNAISRIRIFSYLLALAGCAGVMAVWSGVLRPAIQKVQFTQEQLQEQAVTLAEARDEALQAASVKSRILMSVSHDARTPLSSIILTCDIMLRFYSDDFTEKQQTRLKSILQNAKQLNTFLQNMLDQAKMEIGGIQLVVEPIPSDQLSEELNLVLKPLAESKGLAFDLNYPPDFPATVYGDRTRLLQVLTNLGHNAIKFTDEGGVSIDFLYDNCHWGFRVKDTGQGIPPEMQDRIFDKFWQANSGTTRRNQSGVGLGLAIVQSIVELMGGEIKVSSEPGYGTEFKVWLPVLSLSHE